MKLFEADALSERIKEILKDSKGIVAYKLARNLRLLETELTEFRKIKEDLFRKYGTEQGSQLIIQKDSENYPLFLKELKEYENEEIEIEFRKITEKELSNSDLNGEQIYIISNYMLEE